MIKLEINGKTIEVKEGMTILEACHLAEIYIPALCWHPYISLHEPLQPSEKIYIADKEFVNQSGEDIDCNLCVVRIEGVNELQLSCRTLVQDGMKITTDSPAIKDARQHHLAKILAYHPHACLTCAQKEGCSLTQCSSNVPEAERCCWKFGKCELEKICDYIGIPIYTQKYLVPTESRNFDDKLFLRKYDVCIGCRRCVRVCEEVRGIGALGYIIGNGKNLVGSKSKSLDDTYCRYCGACIELCPTGALKDRIEIGAKFETPCKTGCPIHLPVADYIHAICTGDYQTAALLIQSSTPLGRTLGYVCFHPCEEICMRTNVNNEPLAVCALKRFAMEHAGDPPTPQKQPTGKRIAIIGSGPSGLSAAYYLAMAGYQVEIFEVEPEIGGMLRYGIPGYRLPREILNKDIADITNMGVVIHTGHRVEQVDDLMKEYDAVFTAIGLQKAKRIPVPGSDHNDVLWGLDFLKAVNAGAETIVSGKNVVIIGGGNVAMDVALSTVRLGADKITIACLESYEEMPAYRWEIKEAEEEGVAIINSVGPESIIIENNRIMGISLIKCTSVFNEQKEFAPTFNPDEKSHLDCNMIIFAVGQDSDKNWLQSNAIESHSSGFIKVNKNDLQTPKKGIFAGGDIVTGPLSVVNAIASGKAAAEQIDKYLGGDGVIDTGYETVVSDYKLKQIANFLNLSRTEMPLLSLNDRLVSFKVIECGYTADMAMKEAERCMRCNLREMIPLSPMPPEFIFELNSDNVQSLPESEGVLQLLNEKREIIAIIGSSNIKKCAQEKLDSSTKAKFYLYELEPMYTKRESELLQDYLAKHGKLPEGDGDLDDLF
ncbi:MAG: hypothetical protein A2Y62_09815 [Candidatus Fischerbacteria bacterium RBG_13_37_8]|uniref:BzdV protein n=1 Tax=Candidatus Fischerbacteria bacterium RBG_13_37_8 TaxID=1817863 RepID=A0A1F5V5T6_9BACT|nr:MAG: hypothetical protein A2Y62_09815 [Candidatus Fischerbacteria bacterium RBG_13_37_8]